MTLYDLPIISLNTHPSDIKGKSTECNCVCVCVCVLGEGAGGVMLYLCRNKSVTVTMECKHAAKEGSLDIYCVV